MRGQINNTYVCEVSVSILILPGHCFPKLDLEGFFSFELKAELFKETSINPVVYRNLTLDAMWSIFLDPALLTPPSLSAVFALFFRTGRVMVEGSFQQVPLHLQHIMREHLQQLPVIKDPSLLPLVGSLSRSSSLSPEHLCVFIKTSKLPTIT